MASLKSTLPDPSTLPPGYLDEDKSYILVNAAIVFAALQTVFIGLFFISRIKNKTANGAEMWFMPLGYLFSMSLIVMTFSKFENLRIHVMSPSISTHRIQFTLRGMDSC